MELEECSQKVKERAESPLYMGSEEECDAYLKKKDHFFCHFHFPHSDGEITVYGELKNIDDKQIIEVARFFTNVKGAPLAFLDVMVELAHKRDSQSLLLLKIKEIEAYLRTRNSEPSFPDNGILLPRYYELIHALKNAISKNTAVEDEEALLDRKCSPTLKEYTPHSLLLFKKEKWGDFFYLEEGPKLKIINEILLAYVRPLLQREGGDVECIYVMGNVIVVIFHGNCGACNQSLTTTMDFIKTVLRTELFDKTLDIITDS